jgi:hypothetical protein
VSFINEQGASMRAHIAKPTRQLTVAAVALLSIIGVLAPNVALADGPLTNGASHAGVIEVGGLDVWTFAASRNDSITISIGEVLPAGPDPSFTPWIRLKSPDGAELDNRYGDRFAQIDVRAPLTGTYTVVVAGQQFNFDNQVAPGNYVLTLAKTPGPYTISSGDEGGPMTNAVTHTGTIPVGDLDAWTFHATANASITISIGETPGGSDPLFTPWIRLKGPDGAELGDRYGDSFAQIDVRAPLTGTYTVLVAGQQFNFDNQIDTGHYILTGSGLSPTGFSLAGILAVVGSTPGNGAFFRTSIQIHNPRTSPISGKFVFHASGTSGNANDPSLAYTLTAGQTTYYSDILPAMGIPSGLGSIDIMTIGDPVPLMAARVFSDAGENGTAGFFLDPIPPEAALQVGESGVIIAPADPQKARLNLGIRSLDTGALIVVTVRNKNGVLRGTIIKDYRPNYFEQINGSVYTGLALEGSDTITFSVSSGKAVIYGAQTDNKTQDPSVQYAKRSF